MPIDPQTELLLLKSAEDRECLKYPLPSASFGYHASQAIEKLLKAVIDARREKYPFTHDLETLAKQLRDAGEVLPVLPCNFSEIQPFAIDSRYDVVRELNVADRERLAEGVDKLREWVDQRVTVLTR